MLSMMERLTNPEFLIALATLLTALAALGRACQTRKEVRDLRQDLNKRVDFGTKDS